MRSVDRRRLTLVTSINEYVMLSFLPSMSSLQPQAIITASQTPSIFPLILPKCWVPDLFFKLYSTQKST